MARPITPKPIVGTGPVPPSTPPEFKIDGLDNLVEGMALVSTSSSEIDKSIRALPEVAIEGLSAKVFGWMNKNSIMTLSVLIEILPNALVRRICSANTRSGAIAPIPNEVAHQATAIVYRKCIEDADLKTGILSGNKIQISGKLSLDEEMRLTMEFANVIMFTLTNLVKPHTKILFNPDEML